MFRAVAAHRRWRSAVQLYISTSLSLCFLFFFQKKKNNFVRCLYIRQIRKHPRQQSETLTDGKSSSRGRGDSGARAIQVQTRRTTRDGRKATHRQSKPPRVHARDVETKIDANCICTETRAAPYVLSFPAGSINLRSHSFCNGAPLASVFGPGEKRGVGVHGPDAHTLGAS